MLAFEGAMRFVQGTLLGHRVQKVIRVDLALLKAGAIAPTFDRFFFFE